MGMHVERDVNPGNAWESVHFTQDNHAMNHGATGLHNSFEHRSRSGHLQASAFLELPVAVWRKSLDSSFRKHWTVISFCLTARTGRFSIPELASCAVYAHGFEGVGEQ